VQQSGVGVEAESWTECELNWAGPKSSGYFCICCTRRSHFIDTDTAEIWVHQRLRSKKKTKSLVGFFLATPLAAWHHFEFLRIGVRTDLFQLQQPCSHKKTQKLVVVLLSLYFSKVFLISFWAFQHFFGQRCFISVFFWVIPKKYVRKRQWKRNRVLVKVGCPSRNGNRKRITSAWLSRSVDHMVGPWRIDCVMAAWVDRPQK